MQTILTSNLFFGRKKALGLPRRSNFKNLEEMNFYLINLWNSQVSYNDIVYVLGGFAHDPFSCNDALEVLNGEIIFLNNTIDKALVELSNMYQHIKIQGQVLELVDKNVILSYYPLEIWNGTDSIHFYGDDTIKTDLSKTKNRMNVSINSWGKLVTIDECIDMITEYNKVTKEDKLPK